MRLSSGMILEMFPIPFGALRCLFGSGRSLENLLAPTIIFMNLSILFCCISHRVYLMNSLSSERLLRLAFL